MSRRPKAMWHTQWLSIAHMKICTLCLSTGNTGSAECVQASRCKQRTGKQNYSLLYFYSCTIQRIQVLCHGSCKLFLVCILFRLRKFPILPIILFLFYKLLEHTIMLYSFQFTAVIFSKSLGSIVVFEHHLFHAWIHAVLQSLTALLKMSHYFHG